MDTESFTGIIQTLDPGPYYVVFTNPNSQTQGVKEIYLLEQQYQIISAGQKPEIDNIYPSSAPSGTPTKVTIKGNYFVNHNIPGFEPDSGSEPKVEEVKKGAMEVNIDYGSGTLKLTNSKGEIDTYEVSVKRKLEVEIGRPLEFEENGFQYIEGEPTDPNTFIVKTKDFISPNTQVEDVVIRVTTTITGQFKADMVYEAVRKNGFTYYPVTETPVVKEVIPNMIPVENIDSEYYIHSSVGRLLFTIRGDNFLVTRYEDNNGVEKINYPIITLGGTVINPNDNRKSNEYKPIRFEVLKDGKVVDGTTSNEIGNTIVIELEAGEKGFKIEDKECRNLLIQNPNRKSERHGNPVYFTDLVRFEEMNVNDFPVIDSVRPSLVSIEGGEVVTITGSNLRPGAKVYVDNKLAQNINVSGDMKQITFTAPKGDRPGDTLLHVINPNGEIATHVFTYTETYTQPNIDFINPKEGTTNTLVTVKGANFLPPDPTVVIHDIKQIDQSLIYRLIGTRIFIDGHDINEYNRGLQNRIELTEYEGGQIFTYSETEKRVLLGEGYDSVILYDITGNKFYTIVRDAQNNYSIEGGEGIKYEIRYKDEKFYADTHEIKTNGNGILEFNDMTLEAYTPYKKNMDGKIIGHRVKFIDSNTLTFKVPNLNLSPWTGEGYYDVSIVNPDTKSQTIRNGFYFFASSYTRPEIVDVVPDRGPDAGGNIIYIYGPEPDPENDDDHRIGFVNTGTLKTKVFIGGQQVPEGDVTVLPGGRLMEVKVPKTLENIKEKGTDRITVPIVVVNPDGGSYSISYDEPLEVKEKGKVIRGYTYLVPTSNPKINSIVPQRGSAGGGYIVEIFGSDFRDFEPFTDLDGDGQYNEDEPYDDIDGSGSYTRRAPQDEEYKETSKYNPDYKYLTSLLIPKVYFGNKQAEVVEFSAGYLQVIAPPSEEGIVDVYVMNNDSGISNRVRFRYEASNPTINTLVPSTGDFRGGTKISIYGNNLENNTLTLIKEERRWSHQRSC